MSELADAVRNALAHQDMVTASTKVKQLLCDELARVDPDARIHRTEYFNHTYVPDVVLKWDGRVPREVFLRFVSTPPRLLADVDLIGASGPVIFDLSPAAPRAREVAELASVSSATQQASERSPQLLITDSEATQHVRPDDAENMVERLVVANLLRSGRGKLDESTAETTVLASRAGYNGAIAAEPDDVRAAVAAAGRLLDPDTERRVERTLQLLWWVGGGAPEEFPISVPDDMELNPSDTQDFLREVFAERVIEDSAFWSRLADRLNFDTLVEVGEVTQSANLHQLMNQLAGRLKLSHVVLDKHERPFPPFDQLAWALEDQFLCLRGPEWECRFTPHGNRFSQRRDEGRPVPLAEADRLSAAYLVEEAKIDEAARQVVLSRKAVDPDQQLGRSLRDLAVGFADDAAVRTIAVLLGDSLVTADFDRMMVGADPDATVRRMATIATRLLAALDGSDEAELAAFLGS